MAKVTRSLILVLALLGVSGLGHAGGASHAANFRLWAELSAPEQLALAPLAADWNHFPAQQQEKLVKIAKGFAKLNPQQQQVLQIRLVAWTHMTPEQRMVARENYKKLLALPTPTQNRVKKSWAEARGLDGEPSAAEPEHRAQ